MANKNFNAELVATIKSVDLMDDGEDLIIEGYANTISKDRAGDVIPAETWKSSNALTNYMKNPILLAFHNHSEPIGKALEVSVTEFGLLVKGKISKAAGKVYTLIKEGILSTFSVGFLIKDAEYDSRTDTFIIKDVELTEISVVSVPCNQDSIFSVSKSMNSSDFADFKSNYIKDTAPQGEERKPEMTFDVEKFKQEMIDAAGGAAAKAIADAEALKAAEAKKAAEAEAAKKAAESLISSKASEAAKALIADLQASLTEKDNAFAQAVKDNQEQIIQLKDEMAQILASRNNPISNVAVATAKALQGANVDSSEIDRVVMLGMVKNMDMFATKYGSKHQSAMKAVNASSSITVSSDAYETVFSTNLMRDIQAQLVVAPLFREVTMTSANLTIPINPGRGNASWVDAANYGTDASSGNEITVALTERTLKTFKLAAKTYLTEETEEDAIIAVLPLLRDHLVEAHANEIDRAFLLGSGTGQPKGLVTQATAIAAGAAVQVSAAKADGTVLVTAKGILEARRKLGLYGIKLNEVALVISQDAYWDLLLDPEWADVQQVGSVAVKLQGEVGNIYGMPVIVSNQFPAKAASAAYAIMVNKTNFVVARQRGATVKTDFDVEKDRRVIVATQRLNLEPLIEASAGNGKGVVAITYAAV